MSLEKLDHLRQERSPREVFTSARRLIKGWTWAGTYLEACALVTGYFAARDKDMAADFQRWLVGRHGGERKVVFWSHVLRLAFPDVDTPDPTALSSKENATAVDKLFALLLEWLDDVEHTT
jgi:hypothetical protein